jgi:hypothetical protein
MPHKVNSQYNLSKPDSLVIRVSGYQRRRMFDRFLQRTGLPKPEVTILDVGVTSSWKNSIRRCDM